MNILSIQSHVAYGHVGNSAAVFALQRIGVAVWPVHTVQFSNHPGYGGWRGHAFEGSLIGDLVQLAREDRVEPSPEPIDLREVIGNAIERARRRGPRRRPRPRAPRRARSEGPPSCRSARGTSWRRGRPPPPGAAG